MSSRPMWTRDWTIGLFLFGAIYATLATLLLLGYL